MKLKKKNGVVIDASISKGQNIVLTAIQEGTGARTRAELEQYINEKEPERIEEYELVEASKTERALLREAGHNMKGL